MSTNEATATESKTTQEMLREAKAGLYELTTLGALGRQLPIGLVSADGRALSKSFTLKPFTFEEELAIGEMREQARLSTGEFIVKLLALMTEEVGGTRIADLKDDASRELFFLNMFMADVLYMYVWLRIEAMTNVLSMLVTCPGSRCASKPPFEFHGDLNGLDVRAVKTPSELEHVCKLRGGIRMNERVATELKVMPPKWSALYGRDLNNKALVQLAMFTGAVVGFAGEEGNVAIPELCFRRLTKMDAEVLSTFISKATPGPQMILGLVCPRCKMEWIKPLDWGYDGFFAVSSLSEAPTT